MTIRFSCDCGQSLAVRDENAGKRVRCTACSSIVSVPDGTPPPRAAVEEPPPPSAGSTIRFSCEECGKAIQTRATFAGKKTKCPGCGTVLTIPSAEGDEAPAAVQAEKPKPRRVRAEEDEDEDRREENEEEAEARPRRRKKKQAASGGSGKLWIGVAVGLLLLVGGGFAAWMLFFRGSGAYDGPTEPLDFVPRDALAFGVIQYGDFIRSEFGKQALEQGKKQDPQSAQLFRDKTGMQLEDFERFTLVTLDLTGNTFWIVVQMNKDYDRSKLISGAKVMEMKHQGKKYYADSSGGFIFVDNKTFVVGSIAGVKRCLELPKKPMSGPLDEVVNLASSSKQQIFLGGSSQVIKALGGMAGAQGGGPGAPKAKPWVLEESKLVYLTANVAAQVSLELTAELPDNNRAGAAKIELDDLVSKAKGFLLLGELGLAMLKAQLPGVDLKPFLAIASKLLTATKTRQDGAKVSLSISLSQAELMKLGEEPAKGGEQPNLKPRPRPR